MQKFIDPDIATKMVALGEALVNQEKAKVIVEPQKRGTGFWFGGGDVIRATDGSFYLCGRYRNYGDSRTGVGAGERGLELAIFRAGQWDGPWEKVKSFSKGDLVGKVGAEVVSIEGSSLLQTEDRVELFVSTERGSLYPKGWENYQKPGAGVWGIDLISAGSIDELDGANLEGIMASQSLAYLHLKDPVAFEAGEGKTGLIFCNHPFTWSSSNSGLAIREEAGGDFQPAGMEIMSRGPVWDVACTRVTDVLHIPPVGGFGDGWAMYFYDGAECLRSLDENPRAAKRPRGYSCEEIGGLAGGRVEDGPTGMARLSFEQPLFLSPHGTGCSRYVSTLVTDEGILATWQQSQDDLSQPLVANFVSMDEVAAILG